MIVNQPRSSAFLRIRTACRDVRWRALRFADAHIGVAGTLLARLQGVIMTVTDEFVEANKTYQQSFKGPLPLPPARHIAVVACMDARLDPAKILGINEGDAHVIRNAGGVVTEDVLRSLAISQRLLGTEEIVLIHHTDCGMVTFTDDAFRTGIEAEVGIRPSWSAEAFPEPGADVVQSINRIKASPFVPYKDMIRGFVFDVATGAINEVGVA
ncbi:MAG: hypothetical protein JWP10_1946 [Nocardioidaceae bacterium]|nr:hypothetical protein [Nocardioidaceae bacterium]